MFLQALKDGIEKGSLDYARDWAEAVSCAYADLPVQVNPASSSPTELIPAYVVERLVQGVLAPTAASNLTAAGESVTAEAAAEGQAESFTSQSKALQLTSALLQADQEANFLTSTTSQLGVLLTQILLSHSDLALISPYRSTRNDIAYLLFVLAENAHSSNVSPGVSQLCLKIAATCQSSALAAAATITTEGAEDGAAANSPQAQLFKNAAETVCITLRLALQNLPLWRLDTALEVLFSAALIGAGSMTSSAIETAKLCHDTCLLVANTTLRSALSSQETNKDLTARLLAVLLTTAQDANTPLHSRETLMKCVSLIMGNNWYTLSNDERKVSAFIFYRFVLVRGWVLLFCICPHHIHFIHTLIFYPLL